MPATGIIRRIALAFSMPLLTAVLLATSSVTAEANVLSGAKTGGATSVNLNSNKDFVVEFQPSAAGSWYVGNWIISTTKLEITGYGTVNEADQDKSKVVDLNTNTGRAVFSAADLSRALAGFSSKQFVSVAMVLRFDLIVGDSVEVPFTIQVKRP